MHASSFVHGARSIAALLFGSFAQAQQPPPTYGEPVTLEQAKKIAAAAEAEAKKIDVSDNIAIVDPRGQTVFFQRMDGNQELGTVAIDKAVTAARFRRPTTASDADKPGGLPILIDGKIIGAIGIGGGRAPQDAQVAEAGLAAIK
jgi:glc operon protein GlcG